MKKFLLSLIVFPFFQAFSNPPIILVKVGKESDGNESSQYDICVAASENSGRMIGAKWYATMGVANTVKYTVGKYGKGETRYVKIPKFSGEISNLKVYVGNTLASQYAYSYRTNVVTIHPSLIIKGGIRTKDTITMIFDYSVDSNNNPYFQTWDVLLGDPDFGKFYGGINTGICFMYAYFAGYQTSKEIRSSGAEEKSTPLFGLVQDYGRPFIDIDCSDTNGLWNITGNPLNRATTDRNTFYSSYVESKYKGIYGLPESITNGFSMDFSKIRVNPANPQGNERHVLLTKNYFDYPIRGYDYDPMAKSEMEPCLKKGSVPENNAQFYPLCAVRRGVLTGFTTNTFVKFNSSGVEIYISYAKHLDSLYMPNANDTYYYNFFMMNEGFWSNGYFTDGAFSKGEGLLDFGFPGVATGVDTGETLYFYDNGMISPFISSSTTNRMGSSTYEENNLYKENGLYRISWRKNPSPWEEKFENSYGNTVSITDYVTSQVGAKTIYNPSSGGICTNGYIFIDSRPNTKLSEGLKYAVAISESSSFNPWDDSSSIARFYAFPCGISDDGKIELHFQGLYQNDAEKTYYCYVTAYNSAYISPPYDRAKKASFKFYSK